MFLHPILDTLTIEVNHTTRDKERSAINNITTTESITVIKSIYCYITILR